MPYPKPLMIVLLMMITLVSYSQERSCGPVDVYYRFHREINPEPVDSILKIQYDKLEVLESRILEEIQKTPSLHLIPITEHINFTKQHGYDFEVLEGYDGSKYQVYLV